MKRVGNLFEKICSLSNLETAVLNASANKRKRRRVRYAVEHKEQAAAEIRRMLLGGTFRPGRCLSREIYDHSSHKVRTINCPLFWPDQIVHWAIIQVIRPVLMRGMSPFSCGSIPGRGIHYGQKYLRRWLSRDHKNTKYCLKLDVRKFYQSVGHAQLKAMLRRKIKDKQALALLDAIVDSYPQGLPIGYYTSQWLANFYLEDLDHYIKEQLGIRYALRYVDDMVLFGPSKRKLHKAREQIAAYLKPLGLELKVDWQVFRVDKRPVDMLGYRFYRDHVTLRRRNALKIRRRVKRAHKRGYITLHDARAILSNVGMITHSNSNMFYKRYIVPYVNIKKLKELISNADKKQHQAGRNRGGKNPRHGGGDLPGKHPGRSGAGGGHRLLL